MRDRPAGYSEQTSTRTTFTDRFNNKAKLLIAGKVARPAGSAGAVDLGVVVGGRRAALAGGCAPAVGVSGLPATAGGFCLEFTAR